MIQRSKSLIILIILLIAMLPALPFPEVEAYNTVDNNVTNSQSLIINTQRKIIYDGTRWWLFYYDGSNVVYKSSTDTVTWSVEAILWSRWLTGVSGTAVTISGSKIYAVAESYSAPNFEIWFTNGTISGSTINWNASNVRINYVASELGAPSITVGTDGKIWVSTNIMIIPKMYYYYSTNGGSTWSQTTNNQASPLYGGSELSPMGTGQIMSIYHGYSNPENILKYSLWSGSSWSTETTVALGTLPTADGGFSLVADTTSPNIQYATFLSTNTSNIIRFAKYNSGWGSPETVATGVDSTSYPSISYDGTNSRVIVSWVAADVAYVRVRNNDGSWDAVETVEDLSTYNVFSPQDLTASKRDYQNKIGLAVVTGGGSPFNVTWLSYNIPPAVGTCNTTSVTLLNPEADNWVYADEKFYQFEAQYNVDMSNATARPNLYYFQTSDGYHNITVSYNYITKLYTLINGSDYVKVPKTNSTGWISYDAGTYTLSIIFPLWFDIKIEDTLGAGGSL